MEKIIVYGSGKFWKLNKHLLEDKFDIIAYVDSNIENCTAYSGKKVDNKDVILPDEISNIKYDYLYIAANYESAHKIYWGLVRKSVVDAMRIRFLYREIEYHERWVYKVEKDASIISQIGNIKVREASISDSNILCEVIWGDTYRMEIPYDDMVFIEFARHGRALTGESPEHAQIVGSV